MKIRHIQIVISWFLPTLLCVVFLWNSSLPLPAAEPQGVPAIKVVYFLPNDCQAPKDRHERLGRVMIHIQDFFRREMERHGYGPMTFALEWESPGRLHLHEVRGKHTLQDYHRDSGWDVFEEVRNAWKPQGIDIDKEYVLIVGPFLIWDGDVAKEWGPYAGGGTPRSGYAWVIDDQLMDADMLSSKASGGYFFGPCSIGVFNTKYIGGIAHELGHCFGLPHDGELDVQKRSLGTSLMGNGNHTYGEELRNEGRGTFLSHSAALRLSTSRAFNPEYKSISDPKQWDFDELKAAISNDNLIITGHGSGKPLPIAVVAYNDNLDIPSDYDAKSWVAELDHTGEFRFKITEVGQKSYEMRILAIFADGETKAIKIRYSGEKRTLTLGPLNSAIDVKKIKQHFLKGETAQIKVLLEKLAKQNGSNRDWKRKLNMLTEIDERKSLVSPGSIPANTRKLDLTMAKTQKAQVGWHAPARNLMPEDGFIEVNGRFFEFGFYAQSPSIYSFSLDGKWKRFEFGCGLQDGHPGSVVFVVRGDGKEIFRSGIIKNEMLIQERINLGTIKELELITEDAGDGTAHDWGIWLNPILTR